MKINQARYDDRWYQDEKKYKYRARRRNRHFERDFTLLS